MPALGGTEDAAYRAGLVDGRLEALEQHAVKVNGSIDRTADALVALTVSVQGLQTTLDIHDMASIEGRVHELEKNVSQFLGERAGVVLSGRALVALLVTLTAVVSTVIVVINLYTH